MTQAIIGYPTVPMITLEFGSIYYDPTPSATLGYFTYVPELYYIKQVT